MAELQIKSQTDPLRCDVCHQSDQFDPLTNQCLRCKAISAQVKTSAAKLNTGDEGVYYANKDYASLTKRLIIAAIDIPILGICWVVMVVIWAMLTGEMEDLPLYFVYIWFGVAYFYLALLRVINLPTLGNLITRTKVVDLKGNTPSFFQMTLRFLMLTLGPLNFLLDLFWLGGDAYKQALRDKFAGTYVIKKDAQPLGRGVQQVVPYQFFGFSFLFREVKHKK